MPDGVFRSRSEERRVRTQRGEDPRVTMSTPPRVSLAKDVEYVDEPDGTTSMILTYVDGTRKKFTGVKVVGFQLDAGPGDEPTGATNRG